MKLMSLFMVFFAPLPFWAIGMACCLWGTGRRLPLSPLVGCAAAGLYAELAMMCGLPVRTSVAVLTIASAAVAFVRARAHREALLAAVREWVPLYLLCVLISSISPFPVLGSWSGDWFLLYQMGEQVIQGDLPRSMLARPPLFGAATVPLWLWGRGLIPYQMMSAVASASAVTALLWFVDYFWPRSRRTLLVPLLLSPFFLNHTAAAWGKLLASGLILAAIIEARQAQRLASAALFALSVAVHEGSIIWAPCILVAHAAGGRGWRGAVRSLPWLLVAGIVIVLPLQLWIFAKYGLAAKVAGSPVITDRNEVPFAIKSLLAVVTTFVAWGPISSVARWLTNPERATAAVALKESYWLITSWFTTLAGTLVGLLFPFAICWRRLRDDPVLRRLLRPAVICAVGIAIAANALLTAFYSNEGTMQAALVPLALGIFGVLAGVVTTWTRDGRIVLRRVNWMMAIVGTLPWLLTNVAVGFGIRLSAAFRARMETGSEGDYMVIVGQHLQPLGLSGFPEVPFVVALLLAAWLLFTREGRSLRADLGHAEYRAEAQDRGVDRR